jgi:nucleotide-binding universal stress UspA family protein
MDYQRVIVPLDGSPLAECVLPHLETLAASGKIAVVELVRIVPSLEMHYRAALPLDANQEAQINAAAQKEAGAYLQTIKSRLESAGIRNIITTVLIGHVANSLVEHIEKSGADLLLIATHGRSGPSRWVWGSVTDRLLHVASVPVFVVRPQGCLPEDK